jgi:hypothetical protein
VHWVFNVNPEELICSFVFLFRVNFYTKLYGLIYGEQVSEGRGVAGILNSMIPLSRTLRVEIQWHTKCIY